MKQGSLVQQLALLTDVEAESCLNGVLKGLISLQPEFGDLLGSTEEMKEVLQAVASEAGQSVYLGNEPTGATRAKAIRSILVEAAQDAQLSPRLKGWLTSARPTLLDPVTGALVFAGIVLLLSTHVQIDYKREGKKKSLRVKVEKKPTPKKILGEFIAFLK